MSLLPFASGQPTFDKLAPTTTQGDLIYRNATTNTRLGVGTSGQFLQTLGAGANPQWASYSALTGQMGFGASPSGLNPTASTTYYYGTLFGLNPGTTDQPPDYTVPVNCTLVAVYGSFYVVGAPASAGNSTVIIRKNGTTDILTVSSTVPLTANPARYNSTGNAVAVSAGDRLYVKWTTPAWTSAPTGVFAAVTIYFERP